MPAAQNYSIKSYFLNLDRALDRRIFMERQFSRLGLRVERVAAIDGRHLRAEDVEHYRQGFYHLLLDTEIACFLSHRHCWKLIAKGYASWGCVFEDDVYLSSALPDFLNKGSWPDHIELLSFEKFNETLLCKKNPVWQGEGYEIYQNSVYNPGGGGYIVSKRMAEILVKKSKTFSHLVDGFLFNPRREVPSEYGAYQLNPALCVQGYNIEKDAKPCYVYPTSQEKITTYSSKALFGEKDLSYYLQKLKIGIKYFYNLKHSQPKKIYFKK